MSESQANQLRESESEAARTEYVQAGEEARYRHKLMQNSYYLILILNGAFASVISNHVSSQDWGLVAVGCGLAGVSIMFLSITIYVNGSKRGAAWSRRSFIEEHAGHEWFRLQEDTIQRRAKFRKTKDGRIYAPRQKNWIENLRSDRIPYFFGLNSLVWLLAGIWAMWNFFGI